MKQYVKLFENFINEGVNRIGLAGNYKEYQNTSQSMTKFSIGDKVKCVSDTNECFGRTGKIIAFEDATVRWELDDSETGIGQSSTQYRCLPEELESVTDTEHAVIILSTATKK